MEKLIDVFGRIKARRTAVIGRNTDIKLHTCSLAEVTPPSSDILKGSERMGGGPIDLGTDIIEPLVYYPFTGIGIDVIIGLHSLIKAGHTVGIVGILHCPDTTGRNAKLNRGLFALDKVGNGEYKGIYIGSSPIGKRQAIAIGGISRGIVKGLRGDMVLSASVGIEIIVKVNTVNVIIGYYFVNTCKNQRSYLGKAGVIVHRAIGVFYYPLGMESCRIGCGKGIKVRTKGVFLGYSVRIYPSMKLYSALVSLIDKHLKDVYGKSGALRSRNKG
jgi:hypothetical protein